MKLTILGGGGVRMPAFVRAVLAGRPGMFSQICLFEPDATRRATTGRLAVELAAALGQPAVVTQTADADEACTGADYVFSAIRVGGDRGRVIDERVALGRGILGQETIGPGGAAMALRTIPVVLGYCDKLARYSPGAVLINFTNPAGLITQAINAHGKVPVVGVCDTPGGVIKELAEFLGVPDDRVVARYAGLNHLGWIGSLTVDGKERMGELLGRLDELAQFDSLLRAFDLDQVRQVGAIPTEYVFYYYDSRRYLDGVGRAGSSRGEDVQRLNGELITALGKAFADSDVRAAWAAYVSVLGVRHDTYMKTDTTGDNQQAAARARQAAAGPVPIEAERIGGYEGLALRVIDGLSGRRTSDVIVNVPNESSLDFLEPDDIVEIPARVSAEGMARLAAAALPRSARALVMTVKEYERGIVRAALSGDFNEASVALAGHPLVPGITAARALLSEYVEQHGEHLAYLS